MKYKNSMNRLGFVCVTLAITAALSLAGCGGEEEQGIPKVKNNDDLNTQSAGNDDNNTPEEEEKSDCVVICEKQLKDHCIQIELLWVSRDMRTNIIENFIDIFL